MPQRDDTPLATDLAVELHGLTKHFGDRIAVDSIDLTVQRGELFGFLGANGAGKTTTLKMLVGLVQPSAGTAVLCGFDVVTQPTQAKMVAGYVPDHAELYGKLTGREMLSFVATLFQVSAAQRQSRIDSLLEAFGLTADADLLVQSYSRGMRQKLALCAALSHDPAVLFLDEPTVGLDPASTRLLKDVLRQTCAQGNAVFLSTHVLEVAELLCDRVGIINHGRLIAIDTPQNLRTTHGSDSLEEAFLHITAVGDDMPGSSRIR